MRNIVEVWLPLARQGIALLLLCSLAINSGCVTTLGYVPEQLMPQNKSTYVPTYSEVKKWAYDVSDGYDSRATINNQSLYVGALLAAAGIGALTGLAVFDSTSAWIKGIPIGTAFFGSVLAIYSNEERALIYRLASEYAADLITISDKRIAHRLVAAQMPDEALKEAQQDLKTAKDRSKELEDEEKAQKTQATTTHASADAATSGPNKDALNKSAQALDQEVIKISATVAKAHLAIRRLEARVAYAQKRYDVWTRYDAWKKLPHPEDKTKTPNDPAQIPAEQAVWDAFSQLPKLQEAEALCLRDDVNDLMRRVDEHKTLLDPKNSAVAQQLKNVRASSATTSSSPAPAGSPASAGDTASSPVTQEDLSDLKPPVMSRCDAMN